RQDAHAISDVGDLRVHGERGAELADVEEIALPAVREHPARPVQVLPLPLIASSVVEDLDAVVLAVGDVYETLGVGGDVMGNVEASRVGARLSPREEVSAAGIVLVHARVAVTVGDVDVAGAGTQRDVGRPVEGLAALKGGRTVGIAERQQELPLRRELPDGVMEIVGQPERSVRTDRDSVRATE